MGDCDNDGVLDVLLTGLGSSGRVSKIYRNGGGANPLFTDIGAALAPVSNSSVAWGDYDGGVPPGDKVAHVGLPARFSVHKSARAMPLSS